MVQEAEGESQRFNSVLSIYKQSPDVTRDRLFIETMEQVLKDSNKVIIEGGNNVMPYLPLTELMRQQNKAGGSQ
jgi:membrane protease subunit HflK